MANFKIKFIESTDNDFKSINSDKMIIQNYLTKIDNRLSIVNIGKIYNSESVFDDTKYILNNISLQYEKEIQNLIQNFGESKYKYEKSIERDQFLDYVQTLIIIRKTFYKRNFYYFNICILLILCCFIFYILYIIYLIYFESQ